MKFIKIKNTPVKFNQLSLVVALAGASPFAYSESNIGALLEEVVVTASKKKNVENVQDIPSAVSAFGGSQLEALQVRDISGLSYSMPNVALESNGSAKGVANFSVRGIGVNSSIPSIDPAVGLFVDGVYFGLNSGVIFDTFDLESVEVLRGPQGVLFGRNVTGGAVLMNTTDPSFERTTKLKSSVEGGGEKPLLTLQGITTGSLIDDTLAGKLSLYYSDDQGYFSNTLVDGSSEAFGASETMLIRPALLWSPSEKTEVKLKMEKGEFSGDGIASQTHENGSGITGQVVNFDRGSFDFSVTPDIQFNDADWESVFLELNQDVAFGDGLVTLVSGWRNYFFETFTDVDSTPQAIYHSGTETDQEQISTELRYNGQFGQWNVTTGLFYFLQEMSYSEVRQFLGDFLGNFGLGPQILPGGGVIDQETLGIFMQSEYQVSDNLSLEVGVRYNDEEKDAKIASIVAQPDGTACLVTNGECDYDFQDTFSTTNVSGRLGLAYTISDNMRTYARWSRSYRAGGYNVRFTNETFTEELGPGPFEDEQVDSFEIGFKSEPTSSSVFNVALFKTVTSDLQREINISDPQVGVVQVIRNTADAEIVGIEFDGQIAVGDSLLLAASVGLMDGEYTDVFYDLTDDGVIDSADESLDIPRLAKLNYNFSATYEIPMGDNLLSLRGEYAHRDESAYTDNNLGILDEQDRINASVSLEIGNNISLSLYGKNLTDEVSFGNDTQLPIALGPAPLGGTFAPLNKGRVYGLSISGSF